jgi:predicted phage terminase large subunit-like protein
MATGRQAEPALRIAPQAGPQTTFLRSDADIVFYGGAAGAGKSWALLVAPLRWIQNPKFGAVIFRRTYPEINAEGGLWDESETIYPFCQGRGVRSAMTWWFPSGATITFSHLSEEADRFRWKSAQVPWIGFDQVETFTDNQFWYLLSRNRSNAGVPLHIRATCNPDPDSFVARLLDWYIDSANGYPIQERAGRRRYFVRAADTLDWADTPDELVARHGAEAMPKSFVFIPATIQDNPILLRNNPKYLANLRALPLVDNQQLEHGNWRIRATAGTVFRRDWFGVVEAPPTDCDAVRYWDLAATKDGGDWSCGVLLLRQRASGAYCVAHVQRFRADPHETQTRIRNTATQDGQGITIGLSQDPGQAGKWEVQHLVRALDGWPIVTHREEGDKVQRAKPFSAQAGASNVTLLRGPWNEDFLRELENFPSREWHDDQVDAVSNAYWVLAHSMMTMPMPAPTNLWDAWSQRAERTVLA